ncbi:MAG: isoprenyl transferase [Candidatus Reconcilbacillus cellulovorans]|uniref:Isoprenyl transferase n=1 Tax=Candidatus Reconcilbacillus cellulovorans TaxID=1906605 RepID=A0A2A6E0G1_9BACL|nr:MAG: isoprenyl transferase [Candidatus Reconcilbacillus cellulovorans]
MGIGFGRWFRRRRSFVERLKAGDIPRHVAIIMDGNGRWAKRRGLPRVAGHHSGMQTIRKIVAAADRLGIGVLTLYAFSTENWKRPREEVEYLMRLPEMFFPQMIDELVERNVRVRMMGFRDGLPDYTLRPVDEAIRRTQHNTGLILNFALNYGSRLEILHAVRELGRLIREGALEPSDIDERRFSGCLFTSDLPDPDLVIRTSGEIRVSNFMLWQMAYSELWFTDTYWPEFTEDHFYEAIAHYQRRVRRYGGLE